MIAILFLLTTYVVSDDKLSLGYRYYHDLDNESGGSKLRLYVGKQFYNNSKLKFAYERKRTGSGLEAGTWFINQEFKF